MESMPEYRAAVAVWRYCPPLLFAFGTFGNIMTVFILSRMNMKRSAMQVYLGALAVNDTCLLYTGLLRRWVMYVWHVDVRTLASSACKVHTWLVYSLVIVSPWLLSVMTVERLLSVWRPHRVTLLCTRSKAAVVVVAVVVGSLTINGHLLYGVDVMLVPAEGAENGTVTAICYAPNEDYLYFFDVVWSWVDLTLASLLPFTVLLVGNGLILWKVSASTRTSRYLHDSIRPHELVRRRKRTSSMTLTLVALSVVFFVTTSPICVYNILEHYMDDSSLQVTARLQLAWAVVNILMYTNSCVNFYLYCLSGARFRQQLRRVLCCCLNRKGSAPNNVDVHTITNNGHQHRHHHHIDHNNIGDNTHEYNTNSNHTRRRYTPDLYHHRYHPNSRYRHRHKPGCCERRCYCCLHRRGAGGGVDMDAVDGMSLTFHSRVLASALADNTTANDNSTEF